MTFASAASRPAHLLYGNADSTTTWYATRANWTGFARMSRGWPIPESEWPEDADYESKRTLPGDLARPKAGLKSGLFHNVETT